MDAEFDTLLADATLPENIKACLKKHREKLLENFISNGNVLRSASLQGLKGLMPTLHAEVLKQAFPNEQGERSASSGGGGEELISTAAGSAAAEGETAKVLEGLKAVAAAMLKAKLDHDYIHLPPGLSPKIPPPLRTSIYVRKDYREVIKRLRIATCGMTIVETAQSSQALPPGVERLDQPTQEFVGIVLTGPPGCGKSSIMPFVLANLAQSKCTVVYRYVHTNIVGEQYILLDFSCSPPVVGTERSSMPKGILAYVNSKDVYWLLWDGPPKKGQFDGACPTFVMSSPNDDNYHEFSKGRGAAVLNLSPFSLGGFMHLARSMDIADDLALERYRIFGGVPRPALTNMRQTVEDLERDVSALQASQVLHPQLLGVRTDYSHSLVHLWADEDFKPKYLSLASPEVRRIIFDKAYRHNIDTIKRLVVGGVGQPGGVAGFAGHMFEQYCHHLFIESLEALVVEMKRLRPPAAAVQPPTAPGPKRRHVGEAGAAGAGSTEVGGAAAMEVDEEEQEPSHHALAQQAAALDGGTAGAATEGASTAAAVQQLQQLQVSDTMTVSLTKLERRWDSPKQIITGLDKVYLQPSTVNNPSYDACYISGDQRFVLQYTVSGHHDVKQQPVVKLLQRLGLSPSQVKMVFVVPAEPAYLYETFSWQPWVGVRGQPLARALDMEQWVMKVPILPYGSPQGSRRESPQSSGGGAGQGHA